MNSLREFFWRWWLIESQPSLRGGRFVEMEDAQASFQILSLFEVSHLSHVLRTVPPSITHQAARGYESLVEWVVASIIAGDRDAVAGMPNPEEIAQDPQRVPRPDHLLLGRRSPTVGLPAYPRRRFRPYQQQLYQRHSLH